ncbi:hypothetical protein CLV47_12317 [Antricoccus suffuscus]|uniref:PemK-like, MazF-like toxin of type II toxin-antitoxin system n=1 Tax=Antricoccus suffuscus TaxID=1629062 RepID=A0A2T0ZEL4_9ACTN|nr:hypothetical protein CLV47_12317 [Antricoccus suffuscus]
MYKVYRKSTSEPARVGNVVRPMGCVASRPSDPTVWTAIARSSTDGRPHQGDLFSALQPEIGLNKEGYWSLRWIHSVYKAKTGGKACAYLGTLTESEKSQLLMLYRDRLK